MLKKLSSCETGQEEMRKKDRKRTSIFLTSQKVNTTQVTGSCGGQAQLTITFGACCCVWNVWQRRRNLVIPVRLQVYTSAYTPLYSLPWLHTYLPAHTFMSVFMLVRLHVSEQTDLTTCREPAPALIAQPRIYLGGTQLGSKIQNPP
jgi:hypothetical protein